MANGFTVMDMLNENSIAGFDDSPRARFRTKDISIYKMYRNEMNFYKVEDIESLAKDIKAHGLKQNLEVVHEPCEDGEYRIVSGERRWEALKELVSEGHAKFEIATCRIISTRDSDEEQIEIISANSYRIKDTAEILEEVRRLKVALENIRKKDGQIEGYDLKNKKTRDIIAEMMGKSSTKIAQSESINNHLIEELREAVNENKIDFSAAYELSGMEESTQREMLELYKKTGSLTHKEVKAIKKGKAAVQLDQGKPEPDSEMVSESDTGEYVSYEDAAVTYGMNPEEAEPAGMEKKQEKERQQTHRPGDDYEPPHPESITSLCYSCKHYSECNVKTGTCKKCDQYINKAEAEKTDEQRYYEEQERIDRETRKKLRKMEDEEKMKHLPSDEKKRESKFHKIKTEPRYFVDVCIGRKTFELCRNDRDYKVNDMLELLEYKDGKYTERAVRGRITYILEDYTGLEDGYCILGIHVSTQWYYTDVENVQQDNKE